MAQMGMYVEHERYAAELCGSGIKIWDGEGLPAYEGSIEGVEKLYPDFFQWLLDKQFIKRIG